VSIGGAIVIGRNPPSAKGRINPVFSRRWLVSGLAALVVLSLCFAIFHLFLGPSVASDSLGRAIAAPTQMEVVAVNYHHSGVPNGSRFVIRDPMVFAGVRQGFANREPAQLGVGWAGTKQSVTVRTIDASGNDGEFCFTGESARIWVLGLPYYISDSDGGPRTVILNSCLAALKNPASSQPNSLVRVVQD
jgi:hypothetical protein